MSDIQFHWNGIRDAKGAPLQQVIYTGGRSTAVGLPGTVTVTAICDGEFSPAVHEAFAVQFNPDLHAETIHIPPDHPRHADAFRALVAALKHRDALAEKRRALDRYKASRARIRKTK